MDELKKMAEMAIYKGYDIEIGSKINHDLKREIIKALQKVQKEAHEKGRLQGHQEAVDDFVKIHDCSKGE